MPHGLVDSQERDPKNFTRAEWQQAKRAGRDPRSLKAMFQDCWAVSDSKAAFANALSSRGYYLAQGDRRGFVAVDVHGEIYAIAKWTGLRTKEVAARLGKPEDLPTVAETKERIAGMMTDVLQRHIGETESEFSARAQSLKVRKTKLSEAHRNARQDLKEKQDTRWIAETKERSQRLRHGLGGLWDRLTGRYAKVRKQNEHETLLARDRDQEERQALIDGQLAERRRLQREIRQARHMHASNLTRIYRDVADYQRMGKEEPETERRRRRRHTRHEPSP